MSQQLSTFQRTGLGAGREKIEEEVGRRPAGCLRSTEIEMATNPELISESFFEIHFQGCFLHQCLPSSKPLPDAPAVSFHLLLQIWTLQHDTDCGPDHPGSDFTDTPALENWERTVARPQLQEVSPLTCLFMSFRWPEWKPLNLKNHLCIHLK